MLILFPLLIIRSVRMKWQMIEENDDEPLLNEGDDDDLDDIEQGDDQNTHHLIFV